jgi:predicted small integral membrane protein
MNINFSRNSVGASTTAPSRSVIIVRMAKSLLILTVALYLTLVVVNNLTDYNTNLHFVQHVMLMDTTYGTTATESRVVRNPLLHRLAYDGLIIWEATAALLCALGTYRLLRALNADSESFCRSKALAVSGLLTALLLWGIAFIAIGGEWFMMWQSTEWNGEESAQRLFSMTGIVLILLIGNE